jgi:hypothetical protein
VNSTSSSSADQAAAAIAAVGAVAFAVFGLVMLVLIAFSVWLYWRVAVKAGYPGAYSLLLLVPGLNFVLHIVFAFVDWPLEVENRRLRVALGISKMPPEAPPMPPDNPPYPLVPPTSSAP